MTEEEAHDLLREHLPAGTRVTVSQHTWSQSIVGSVPVVDPVRCNWYVAITLGDGLEGTQGEFACTLEAAVERVLARLPAILAEAKAPVVPPPRLTAPSAGPAAVPPAQRNAS